MSIFPKHKKLGSEESILSNFNNRISSAFEEIFMRYYKELHAYASYIFRDSNDICAEDVIQDIFLRLWENKDVTFDSLPKVKAFVYISIKNAYKNHLKHLNIHEKYAFSTDTTITSEDSSDILQFEAYIQLEEYLKVLPNDCGTVLKMYIEGYAPEEIAERLGYQLRTVYNKKQEAKNFLKKKFGSHPLYLITILTQL